MEYNFREVGKRTYLNIPMRNIIQWILFLFINGIFVFKYSQRTSINPYVCTAIYIVFVTLLYALVGKVKTLNYKYATIMLFLCVCALISVMLVKVDPLSVNVDRWSATTYFLDGLFSRMAYIPMSRSLTIHPLSRYGII